MEVIKFEYNPKFHYSFTRKYSIPEDWSEQDAKDFQASKAIDLREELEPLAQAEIDAIQEERDRHQKG